MSDKKNFKELSFFCGGKVVMEKRKLNLLKRWVWKTIKWKTATFLFRFFRGCHILSNLKSSVLLTAMVPWKFFKRLYWFLLMCVLSWTWNSWMNNWNATQKLKVEQFYDADDAGSMKRISITNATFGFLIEMNTSHLMYHSRTRKITNEAELAVFDYRKVDQKILIGTPKANSKLLFLLSEFLVFGSFQVGMTVEYTSS